MMPAPSWPKELPNMIHHPASVVAPDLPHIWNVFLKEGAIYADAFGFVVYKTHRESEVL